MESKESRDPRVSVAWLRERLNDVVVVDATLPPVGVRPVPDMRARFVEGHIPGAVFFDIEEMSDHATALPHMMPEPGEFAAKAGAMGVGSERTIVVYEQEGVFSAPRGWWMLRVMGAKEVRLLDGGLKAWVEAGLPVEAGEPVRGAAEFVSTFDADAVESYDELRGVLREGGQVLDARSAGRFAGREPEPRPGLRAGHMPGATNIPVSEVTAGGRMKDEAGLRAVFAEKGVDLERPITTSCGSGVTAAVLALAAEICGAERVRLYDGSWAEYGGRAESEVVRDA